MTRRHIIVILLVVFGLLLWVLTRTSVSQIQPRTDTIPDTALRPDSAPAEKPDLITVTSPLPESTITSSPLVIKGRARGNWFFEATAPVSIVNWDGLIIGEGYIQVSDGASWMTTDFVPFVGTISYDASKLGAYKYGWIILRKDNPSGEAQFDNSLEFKVFFP